MLVYLEVKPDLSPYNNGITRYDYLIPYSYLISPVSIVLLLSNLIHV